MGHERVRTILQNIHLEQQLSIDIRLAGTPIRPAVGVQAGPDCYCALRAGQRRHAVTAQSVYLGFS